MSLVIPRSRTEMQWSPGAAGRLLRGAGCEPTPESDPLWWQAAALCAETDPEAFFPEKGGSTADAKRVCRSCEVRAECLEYALENDERFGIWGGLSERERRRIKRETGPRLCRAGLHEMTEGNTRPRGGCAACKQEADDRASARNRAARAMAPQSGRRLAA